MRRNTAPATAPEYIYPACGTTQPKAEICRLGGNSGPRGDKGLDLFPQVLCVGRIKTAGHGWLTNRSAHTTRPCCAVYAGCRPRNSDAIFSSGTASARTSARSPAAFSAGFTGHRGTALQVVGQRLALLRERQLQEGNKRFRLDTPIRPARGAMVRRSTPECTCGGGSKAPGGRVNSLSTRAKSCAVAESKP